jgi:hypothetical protein
MKKHFWLIAGTTLGLFLVGFFIGPFVSQWTGTIIGNEIRALNLSDFLVAPLSLGSLLAFCSICAGGLLWAYSRSGFQYDSRVVFGLGLFTSLVTATAGVGFSLLRLRLILELTSNQVDNISVAASMINYFSFGFRLPLLVNALLIAILLWLSRQRQPQKEIMFLENK